MKILLHLIPAALYLLLGVYFWKRPALPSPRARWLCLLPMLLHGGLLHAALLPEGRLHFGLGVAVSLILWLAAVVYWLQSWAHRMGALQTLALPLAALGVLAPLISPGTHVLGPPSVLFVVHFLVAMFAYALSTLALLHALLMAVVEKRLHHARSVHLVAGMPPLLTLETLLYRLIAVVFVLLTLTLASGAVFSEEVFGRPWRFDHKTVFAVLSWGIFGVLLWGRRARGWRGRTALRWIFAGFFTLLLAYLGTHFVLEFVLGRK
jgi:ABC-type uncharacterized transport system permease subunit